jgi:hypothetical protein
MQKIVPASVISLQATMARQPTMNVSRPTSTACRPMTHPSFLYATALCIACILFPLAASFGQAPDPELDTLMDEALTLSRFSPSMVRAEEPPPAKEQPRTIEQIMAELDKVEKDYVNLLDKGSRATGLYLTGEYDSDYRNGADKYYGQVELRLFNDGYFEEQRKDEKKILQTRLELLQLNRDMDERALADALYHLHGIENELHYQHALARIAELEKLLPNRIKARKHGYTTRADTLALGHSLATAKRERDFYAARKRQRLSAPLAAVLNMIEQARLKAYEELAERARRHSPTLAIQDMFIERAEQFPAWSDNLAVDLFAGHRQEFYDLERDYVGVKVEIPLYWDDRRDELIELQQRIYKFQKEAATRRIAHRLDKLCSYFLFYQQKIESAVESLALLLAREQAAAAEIAHPVQRSGDDPARQRQLIRLEIIDARFDSLFYRLKEYELLLKMMAITGSRDFRELLEPAQPDFPARSAAPRPHRPGPG